MRGSHSTFSEKPKLIEQEILAGFLKPAADQACQPEKTGAEQAQRARLGNAGGRGGNVEPVCGGSCQTEVMRRIGTVKVEDRLRWRITGQRQYAQTGDVQEIGVIRRDIQRAGDCEGGGAPSYIEDKYVWRSERENRGRRSRGEKRDNIEIAG